MIDGGVPALVVHDDTAHGVALYAASLADAVARLVGHDVGVPVADAVRAPRAHLHFTDRLWASTPREAASRVEALGEAVPVTVTVHDVPQQSDGAERLERRVDCYRRVVAAAHGVVCSSAHERALLERHCGVPASTVAVIPLPVDPFPRTAGPVPRDGSAGVLGFFYPGKGHAEVAGALAELAAETGERQRLTVLGRASTGHDDELAHFVVAAQAHEVDVEVTGFLPESELVARCRRVEVPVMAHRHVSASGSLAFWLAAGRRPIVTANDYTREMAALRPGTMTLVDEESLGRSVADAFADPDSTWLQGAATRPDRADVAAAHVAWWREVRW